MSEDLRQKVVEAMARAAVEADLDTYDEYDQRLTREMAADMLDALLDTLTHNAEAWVTLIDPGLKWNAGSIAIRDARDLIDALRSISKGEEG